MLGALLAAGAGGAEGTVVPRLAPGVASARVSVSPAAPTPGAAPAPGDSAAAVHGPTGLEALHLTPPPQPPIETFDTLTFRMLRAAFNQYSDRARLVLLLSPTCPYCLRGADAVQAVLSENDSLALRVFVVWMHGIKSDREIPSTLVLSRIHDRRAIQYWDPTRQLAHTMFRQLPPDTAMAIADTVGGPPLIWDALALYRPGTRWTNRFPTPDYAGRPIADVLDKLRMKLREYARANSSARAGQR